MASETILFAIKTLEQGRKVYQSGLKHGVLTVPADPKVAIGDTVDLTVHLVYAQQRVPVTGQVVHTGGLATIVQLDGVPDALVEALGERAAGSPASGRMPIGAETTVVTAQVADDAADGAEEDDLDADSSVWDEDSWDEPEDEPAPATPDPGPAEEVIHAEAVDSLVVPPTAPPSPPPEELSEELSEEQDSWDPEPPPAAEPARPAPRPRPTGRPAPRPTAAGGPAPSRQRPPPSRAPATPAPQPAAPTASGGGRGIPLPGRSITSVPGQSMMEGSLGDRSMRQILMDLLSRKATGMLVVDGFRERYWGYFIDGKPMRYSREPASRSESVEYMISRERMLTPAVLERARYVATVMNLEIDEALVQLGMLPRDKVAQMVSSMARVVTERLLGVNYGSFWFYELPELTKLIHGAPVDVMTVLWERARMRYADLNDKAVRDIVDKLYKHHMIVTEEGRALAGSLSVGGVEERWIKRYLRGGWQIAELLGRLDMPTMQMMALVLALQDLGIVRLSEREGDDYRISRAERYLIDRMDYMERDHFAFVEAHWSSLEPELLKACDKVSKRVEDPLMDKLQLDDLAEMRAQIQAKVKEVRRIFGNTERRREYRAEIIGEDKRMMGAELFLKQGEMELFKQDSRRAKDIFLRVIEIDPGGSGSKERVGRARQVLADLAKGVVTKPSGNLDELREAENMNLEDLEL